MNKNLENNINKNIDNNTGSKSLAYDLFNSLRIDILSGKIPSDTKITEKSVCERYNVSRTPVREAFKQLESDGLIDNIPNRGAYINALTVRDISDLFDLRCTFEMQAVEWAIERMSDDEIDKLRETIEFMEFYTIKNDAEKVMHFNSIFHNTIYDGTKNRMLCQALSTYEIYLKYSTPPRIIFEDYLNTILNEHKAIFDAFENHNVHAGKKAMEYHMNQSKLRRMSRYF